MNCIIVEDQAPAQRILKKYINDIETLNLKGIFADTYAASDCLKKESIDLIFLDIHLPKQSGIEFIKTLPSPPTIILTTAFSNYAVESYELNVADYLVKPFSFDRFKQAIAKIEQLNSETIPNELSFFLKSGYDYIKLSSKDILYINSNIEYSEIHLASKKHLSTETLSYWEQKLSPYSFVRVHKSYIVNISKVQKVSGNQIHLLDEQIIPIGRAYKEAFLSKYIK